MELITSAELINMGFTPALPKLVESSEHCGCKNMDERKEAPARVQGKGWGGNYQKHGAG